LDEEEDRPLKQLNRAIAFSVTIMSCATCVLAQERSQQTAAATHPPATADASFVKEAAMGGMAEVDLGQLASSHATNDKVKSFGQRMVTDHGKANEQLKTLAASKQIAVAPELDGKHQAVHARMAKLSGSAFDRAYVADMLADHKKDVAEFMRQSKTATDPDIKAWVIGTLPTLQEHLKMIEELSKDLHTATPTGSTK
jgi:putative membrane protein